MRRQSLARSTHSVGIVSAYRTNAEECTIWTVDCFPKYYERTSAERMKAAGGAHGERAVRITVVRPVPSLRLVENNEHRLLLPAARLRSVFVRRPRYDLSDAKLSLPPRCAL